MDVLGKRIQRKKEEIMKKKKKSRKIPEPKDMNFQIKMVHRCLANALKQNEKTLPRAKHHKFLGTKKKSQMLPQKSKKKNKSHRIRAHDDTGSGGGRLPRDGPPRHEDYFELKSQ